MTDNKIIPSLWFSSNSGKISLVIDYYKNIFGNDFNVGPTIPLGDTPSGNTEMCLVHIFANKYSFMVTEKEHQPLTDAFSIIINCDNQNEIDKFWNYFTKEGHESQCGWCTDKFGLRWQVIPKNMEELMSKPNAYEVMMNQKKIVIKDYQK